MNKYKEAILPIIEDTNVKAFQIASLLSILGLIILGCSVGLLEVGTFRYIGVAIGLIFMALPFALRFVIDKHKTIGAIKFTEFEILIKLTNEEPKTFDTQKLAIFDFNIIDYEGETKARDLVRTSSTMNVRSGAENAVFWKIDDVEFHFKFKLKSELQKRKALFFLKIFKKQNT